MTVLNSAAAWMDRLSDGIGFYYPGGRFLEPRHPVKVSLTMGLLGALCGLVGMMFCLALLLSLQPVGEMITALIASLAFGLPAAGLIFVPMLVWLSSSRSTGVWAVMLSVTAAWLYALTVSATVFWPETTPPVRMATCGLVGGLCFGLVGVILFRKQPVWLLLESVIGSALLHWPLDFSDIVLNQSAGGWWHEILYFMIPVQWFCGFFSYVGIVMGQVVWDRTPLPKFEPNEAGQPEERVS